MPVEIFHFTHWPISYSTELTTREALVDSSFASQRARCFGLTKKALWLLVLVVVAWCLGGGLGGGSLTGFRLATVT